MSRGRVDLEFSGPFDAVTPSSLASLFKEIAGTPHARVVLELAKRSHRGRQVLAQLESLAKATGRDASWSYLRKLTERVELLADLEEMPEVKAPRGASARKSCRHFLAAAEILSDEADLRKRCRFERVARWLRKKLADAGPGEERECR